MKKENDVEPRKCRFQYVPLAHYEYTGEKYEDRRVAARWAWTSIGKLADLFCKQYCNRNICNVEQTKYLPLEGINYGTVKESKKERSGISAWYEQQSILHRAVSFLPDLNIKYDTKCLACDILMAFSLFPRLILYSPVPPIATVKRSLEEDGRKMFLKAEKKDISIPCCVVEYCKNDIVETDQRIREYALLKFDINDLPGISPYEYKILISYLTRGQLIARKIYSLAFPDDPINWMQKTVEINLIKKKNGWHWFVDGKDRGVFSKSDDTIILQISDILFQGEIGKWIRHKKFLRAIRWHKEDYSDYAGKKGRMRRQISRLRKILGINIIEYDKKEGVRFTDNVVKAKK